jgi:probable rRNA maturation factor
MSDGSRLLFGAIPQNLKFSTEEKRALRQFARTIAFRVAEGNAFTCLITNDLELKRLNHDFLGKNFSTDVLSFPAAHADGGIGEIAISAERAAVQAREFGHTITDEIRILMLHGVLHLAGMDHERDRGEMQEAEQRWRAEFRLPATLIARAAASRRAQ